MVRIQIGSEATERTLEDADPNWITQQINRRRREGVPICVRVYIEENGLNIRLSSSDCPGLGGGGRPPTVDEREILERWRHFGLDGNDFAPGQLVAFLRWLRR